MPQIDDMDKKLKDLFGGMRAEDEANAPSFESCRPSNDTRTFSYSPIWRVAASFALIVFLGAGALKLQTCTSRQPVAIQPDKLISMSSWQASTDNLITMSETNLDGTFTTETDLWLEYPETNGKGSL
ncbi:MAG TPA: hypothetical protein DET40_10165 [Lentisphaeria bacterium]|nr:MAG: hypothetical protein A2X45_10115 [Lentisphaerae bacterium GWF2_50_93]HCE43900.1 hypothetical protein [Lentisphaeria bacterium]